MAQYSSLSRQQIEEVIGKFITNKVKSFEPFSGGAENTSYLVTTEAEELVLTIFEQKSEKQITELALLLEHLASFDFKTSIIHRNRSYQPIDFWEGKPVMLKNYIRGNVTMDLSASALELIGKELGKLHKVPAPDYLQKQIAYGREEFQKVKKYAPGSDFDGWLEEKMEYLTPYFSDDLPKAFIHADVFYDNIIVSENEKSVQIMDFEEAAYYYRNFDIGMIIIGVCGENKIINFEKAKSILKGYELEIALTDLEISSLRAFTIYAATAMTFWRHINFNYTNPTPGMEEHFLGLKVYADFMSEQPDDCLSRLIIR